MTLFEVDEAASRVREEVDSEANIIVGATFDETLGDKVRVSIVASGMARMIPRPDAGPPEHGSEFRLRFEFRRADLPASGSNRATAGRPSPCPQHAPHAGQRREPANDDMHRRLSEALAFGDEDVGAPPYTPAGQPQGRRPMQPEGMPRPQPQSGNVTIEEGLPSHLTPTAPGAGWRQPNQRQERGRRCAVHPCPAG